MRYTKRCEKKGCQRIDYMYYKEEGRSISADFKAGNVKREPNTEYFVPDDHDYCDVCLLNEYGLGLSLTYDSMDHLASEPLISLDKVLEALRKARNGA